MKLLDHGQLFLGVGCAPGHLIQTCQAVVSIRFLGIECSRSPQIALGLLITLVIAFGNAKVEISQARIRLQLDCPPQQYLRLLQISLFHCNIAEISECLRMTRIVL